MYNQHDHTHCWKQDSPPCGQKIKHFECCLCKKEHPEIEAERQKREEVVEAIIKMADELESECNKDYDKGTLQWKHFKGFRNTIRDKYITRNNNPK